MDYQYLTQCTKLVSTLLEMKQKGTVCIKIGQFNFEFSNEGQAIHTENLNQNLTA